MGQRSDLHLLRRLGELRSARLGGENLVDRARLVAARHTLEAQAHDLGERRVRLGEARRPAR
jgi:hypothetical protein